MRRLGVTELRDTIVLPRSAQIMAVDIGRLLYSYDDADTERVQRRFVEKRPGDELTPGLHFVGTYQAPDPRYACQLAVVFELLDSDIPADLPAEAYASWRQLTGDGFKWQADELPPAWLRDSDEPLTTEQVLALATLDEHGYGELA